MGPNFSILIKSSFLGKKMKKKKKVNECTSTLCLYIFIFGVFTLALVYGFYCANIQAYLDCEAA